MAARHSPRGLSFLHPRFMSSSLVRLAAKQGEEYNPPLPTGGLVTQKVIDVVGTSKDSFAKAAANAVKEAAKTVRGIKWAHIESLDMLLDGAEVTQYRATTKIYFDVET